MLKILIVDDNEINLKLLERIILGNTSSVEVIKAVNGQEAFELALKEKPVLVFMDMMMPVLDGYSATKKIKDTTELSKIPVVAITAVNTKGDIKKVFDCGCEDILQKPISLKTVVDLIEKYIKTSQ